MGITSQAKPQPGDGNIPHYGMGGCKPPYFGEKMNNIILTAVISAVIMLTSMVWFLLTNITHWTPETIVPIIFIFGGGASSMYLASVVISRTSSW